MFVDTVLVNETKEEMISKGQWWKNPLESKGFGLKRMRMEYIECNSTKTI